jgi:hypothetical protein
MTDLPYEVKDTPAKKEMQSLAYVKQVKEPTTFKKLNVQNILKDNFGYLWKTTRNIYYNKGIVSQKDAIRLTAAAMNGSFDFKMSYNKEQVIKVTKKKSSSLSMRKNIIF